MEGSGQLGTTLDELKAMIAEHGAEMIPALKELLGECSFLLSKQVFSLLCLTLVSWCSPSEVDDGEGEGGSSKREQLTCTFLTSSGRPRFFLPLSCALFSFSLCFFFLSLCCVYVEILIPPSNRRTHLFI